MAGGMSDAPETRKSSTAREYVDSTLVTVVLALFLTTFIVQAFKIPSSSMEDTLLVGDHLLVNKFVFGDEAGAVGRLLPYREVRRGDIIVFKYPYPPYPHFVKRVIGLPGDRLKIVNRQVYINGERLEEPYKIHRNPPLLGRFQDDFPVQGDYFSYASEPGWAEEVARLTKGDELVIPPHKYFAMGDNRDNSRDSRYWGFVDRENIIGRPLLIYWSFDASRRRRAWSHNPTPAAWDNLTHFFARTRWNRLLHFVR